MKNIHFIGIGGSGMSGLARILKAEGNNISGSDMSLSKNIELLSKEGFKIMIGQNAENIPGKTDRVIYSPAVPKNNPERIAAKKRKIPEYSYPQAVGMLTKNKHTVCICGTHGKTTTTAMAAAVFLKTKKDPTVIVGAVIRELNNSNARCGKGPELIIESCEYRRGFLNYQPSTIIITNIEADHLDYYKNLSDYKRAFLQFVQKLPKNGRVIANHDDKNIRAVLKNSKNTIIWFGKTAGSDYRLKKNIMVKKGENLLKLELKIPGEHNLMNAAAVIALADEYKLPVEDVKKALEQYQGSSRRFENVGSLKQAIIIDDYGHHPTEIKATLKAARDRFGKKAKILCIFQPHQLSRTHKLLKDFSNAFHDADEVIIPNIYSVRDTLQDAKKMNTGKLVQYLSKNHQNVRNGLGFDATVKYVKAAMEQKNGYDVIITMGAGDVYKIAEALTK